MSLPPGRRAEGGAPSRPARVQPLRRLVQAGFVLLCLWIGIEFHLFVKFLEAGGSLPPVPRPPGVEAFLPISSLMSLYLFFLTGEIHPFHPAGMFILAAVLLLSLCFPKSFCSFVCPFGLLSDVLAWPIERLRGRRTDLPRFLDRPLRSLKYLLFGFFGWAVFSMSAGALRGFLDSPYNLLADVKMYLFFARISSFALAVIAGLVLLSMLVRGFWCRYLCPYGAFLGLAGLLGLFRIRRRPESCTDCGLCRRACPSRIRVDRAGTVVSDECTFCLECVDACPVPGALEVSPCLTHRAFSKWCVPAGVVALFLLVTGLGRVTGHWQNRVPVETYLARFQRIDAFDHVGGLKAADRAAPEENGAGEGGEGPRQGKGPPDGGR